MDKVNSKTINVTTFLTIIFSIIIIIIIVIRIQYCILKISFNYYIIYYHILNLNHEEQVY